jgi:hypothetical protein
MNEDKELRAKRRINKKSKDRAENKMELKYKPPKNWKHVYLRSEKLRRAKQLGTEYPSQSNAQLLKENL